MEIKETNCKCCNEKTRFAYIYYEKRIPICKGCIMFIKKLNSKEFAKLGANE